MNAPIDPTASLLKQRAELSKMLTSLQIQVVKMERQIRDIDAILIANKRTQIGQVVGEGNQS